MLTLSKETGVCRALCLGSCCKFLHPNRYDVEKNLHRGDRIRPGALIEPSAA